MKLLVKEYKGSIAGNVLYMVCVPLNYTFKLKRILTWHINYIRCYMLLSNFEMKLFKKNGLWGVKDEQNEFVPPNYKDPKDAVYEWKWFEIDNLNKEKHRKYLPWNKTLDEINQIEKDLLNCI